MMRSIAHQHRFYRDRISAGGLLPFSVAVQETDLLILAETTLIDPARRSIIHYRYQVEEYIRQHPAFLHSLSPMPIDAKAPPIVRDMLQAAKSAGVGPMAAVAGAFAEKVGGDLLQYSREVVVENGGDIYLNTDRDISIGIYAGASPLSGRLALHIRSGSTPLGVCTSSGTVGHSFSFGRADAVTIIAPSASLADAAATAVANCVTDRKQIPRALERARELEGVLGAIIIIEDQMGAWGEVELVSV